MSKTTFTPATGGAFNESVARALAEQPWYIRRKDTITAVAGTAVQLLNLVAFISTGWPEWALLLVAILTGAAQALVHAGTRGAITPSMAGRLEAAAVATNLDAGATGSAVPVEPAPTPGDLPVYDGESTNGTTEYVGEHRAGE